ncbi:MAG: DUF421 domain-containing protein [Gammaproteobacteria bacterium]|nr:DUF421 domain-containing protein [Gammaproteobacteria bacterium]MBU1444506.1 DUF421 domain-containing protein [Gammaproteobacteria bacterium]MBU2285774.1 DUF421 domain-containing protein [Gammaproteobacteria bacterium]MBU2410826.1 DUF421 domain-containing protein [Gammaproteobacteria bacterium]
MPEFMFDGWQPLGRTLALGVLAYVGLVVMLRASGKRTLSKMNAFDLIVTVALGSTLATVLLSKDVSLAQGLLALALLVLMQFVVTWLSVRIEWVRRLVTSEPALLAYDGQLLHGALRRARVTPAEVFAAVRAAGLGDLSEVGAAVLETEGSCSIVKRDASAGESLLEGVKGGPERNAH